MKKRLAYMGRQLVDPFNDSSLETKHVLIDEDDKTERAFSVQARNDSLSRLSVGNIYECTFNDNMELVVSGENGPKRVDCVDTETLTAWQTANRATTSVIYSRKTNKKHVSRDLVADALAPLKRAMEGTGRAEKRHVIALVIEELYRGG